MMITTDANRTEEKPMRIDYNEINQCQTTLFDITPNFTKYLFLAKKERVDFVYNTAALEGNAMTFPEVQTLLEGITVGGHKLSDEQQILNQNRSVQLLFEMVESRRFILSKDVVCALHAEVSRDEALSWGVFRDGGVNIGGTEYIPPKASLLDEVFESGVNELAKVENPILQAISYFLFGAKSQFFYDGNKRVSRLIMNGILLSNGYPMLNIKARDKLEFNTQMIRFYESDSPCEALRYLADYYAVRNRHLVDG